MEARATGEKLIPHPRLTQATKTMRSLFSNTLVFAIGYVVLMIPTYALPWLGSNSAVLNALGATIGHGMMPQWWAHAWCLVMLVLMAWMRGDFIGKKYLPVFPFLAAVFDLTPGLNVIPLIPTALHLAAIILGTKVVDQQALADGVGVVNGLDSVPRKAGILAGLMTAAAISGSIFFVSTSKKSLSEFAEQKSGSPIKNSPAKPESSLPATVVPPPVSVPPKTDIQPPRYTDSSKHSTTAAIKNKLVQKTEPGADQGAVKKAGGVRYINLNE